MEWPLQGRLLGSGLAFVEADRFPGGHLFILVEAVQLSEDLERTIN